LTLTVLSAGRTAKIKIKYNKISFWCN
jgi:hypothetical protein